MIDQDALAVRLAEIVDDTSGVWPGIYRADAQTWGAEGLDPASLSDGDVREAIRQRILSRMPALGRGRPPTEEELAENHEQLRQHMVGFVFGTDPEPPPVRELATMLGKVDGGTWSGPGQDRYLAVAGRYAAAHALAGGGALTDRGRRMLEILGGAR